QKTLAVVESRKNSAETKFAALSAELERLLADGSQRSTSTLESEQEIEVQEQALHEAQAAVGDAAHEKAEAEEVSNSRRSVVKDAEETLNNIKSELSAAQARIKVLEQSLQPASGTALAALHEHDPHDVSDILNIEPGWETAIAALLAASTDRAWLNSLETSIAAVETLQQHDVADIRIFYPSDVYSDQPAISNVRFANSVISARKADAGAFEYFASFLQSAVLVEELEDARQLLEHIKAMTNPHIRIATRAGHVLTSSWLDFHGDGSISSLERRAEYDQAIDDVARLSEELEQAKTTHATVMAEHLEAETVLRDNEPQLQEDRWRVVTLQERIALQKKTLEQQYAAQKRHDVRLEKLQADVERARVVLEEARESYYATEAVSNFADDNSTGVEAATEAQQQAEQEATAARVAETEARLALRTAENTHQQAEQRIEQSRRRRSAAKIAQQEYQRALVRQRKTIERLKALDSAISTAIVRIDSSVQRAENDYQELEQQGQQLQGKVDLTEQKFNQARKQLTNVQEQLHERKLLRQEHQLKLEQLHERSLNELGYSHQYLVTNFGPNQPIYLGDVEDFQTVAFDRKEQKQRLRLAKRDLNALGKINSLALEEYAAVQERHDYLTQQLSDLEASRKTLLNIIEDVDATMLKVFTAAYQDTAEQFQHVFATVFPGGEGKL